MKNGPYELIVAPFEYPGKKYRERYAYEHHVVYWINFGKLIDDSQVIHHKNGKTRDNRIENLEVQNAQNHRKYHGQENRKKSLIVIKCANCKTEKTIRGSVFRTRIKLRRWNKLFCSSRCGAIHQHTMRGGGQGDSRVTVNDE